MPHPELAPIDYAALRARIPMSRVLELLGFRPLRGRSPQLRGQCPLRNCPPVLPPRFSVNLQRHIYRCFACGSAGNQLDLWAAAHRLSLPAAAVHLCRVTGTPVPRRLTASQAQPSTRPATV
jgi:DNA primase